MQTEVRRQLSAVERLFSIADQTSSLNVIARVRLTGPLSEARLKRAAADLMTEHPLLRVAIHADADGAHPAFSGSSRDIPIRRLHGDDTEWERQVDTHELGTSVDWTNGPLIRIVDIVSDAPWETHDLVLTVSHVIADGTTALTLLRRLVEHAARPSAPAGADTVWPRPVIGAPEELLPAGFRGPRGLGRIVATGLSYGVAIALARPCRLTPESLTPESTMSPAQRRTRLVRCMLSSTQLDILMRRCREEAVTVHDALAAAMAMVVGPTAAKRSSGRICIASPIDFRAELVPSVSAYEAGSFVCSVPLIARFNGDRELWSIARQINRSFGRSKRSGQHLAMLRALRFIWPASLSKSSTVFGLNERYGFLNVGIWNLDRYEFPTRIGDWQLSGAQFLSGIMPFTCIVATVNTSHGELFWNFTYTDGAVSQLSAQRLADGCLQALLAAVGERKAAV